MEQNKEAPLVSIIIPTFNSQKDLEKCLKSIKHQTYAKTETIIVDRYSTDGTVRTAKKFGTRIFQRNFERSKAKNYGAQRAKGQFLLFIDSDMTLEPNVIKECVEKAVKEDVDAVIIPETSKGNGLLAQCRKLEKDTLAKIRNEKTLFQIPRFFQKNVFFSLSGFNEELVFGEDFDLYERFKKTGYKTGKINSKIFHHENTSLRKTILKAYHYGKTLPTLFKMQPSHAFRRHFSMSFARLRLLPAETRSPLLFVIFSLKLVECFAYALGMFLNSTTKALKKITIRKVIPTNKFQVFLSLSLLTLISFVIFRNFFFTDCWPGGGDVLGWISRVYIFGKNFRWLYTWRPYSFGFVEQINSMDFFLMSINFVCQDGATTTKIFSFASFLIAGFSMYAFAHCYTRNNLAALSASLVYMLNRWLFTQLTEMHLGILFSYALAPLLFLFLDRALSKGHLKDLVIFSLLFSICLTGFHPASMIIYTSFLALFTFLFVFTPTRTLNFQTRLKRSLKVILCSCVLAFLLSSFYVIPFIYNVRAHFFSQEFGYHIEEAFLHSYRNMTDAFTLKGVESWGYKNLVDVRTELSFQLLPVSAMLFYLFLLAYSTIIFKRDRYTLFFLLSGVIATFLAKGPYPPFEHIFIWAWSNVPHFKIFRASSRFAMMSAFCHAFFVSVLVSLATNYISKRRAFQPSKIQVDVTLRFSKDEKRVLYVSSELLNRIIKPFQNFLHHFCTLLLVLILLSGFLSCYFFLYHGLQTYKPPANIIAPYEWIAEQPGHFKIVSVSRAPGEWEFASNLSDIGFSGMLTSLGWGHDLGYESSFIHDKPVLQNGGWEQRPRMFVWHLRFQQVRWMMTDNLLKLLGTFNYKYVVLPPYTSQEVNEFFLNQKGAVIIYNQSNSRIIENKFFTPRIFGATQHVFVVGGLKSLFSLLKIESFNPNQTIPFFLDRSNCLSLVKSEIFNSSQALLFVDSDFMDLVMLSSDDINIITAYKYGMSSRNYTKYWAPSYSWREVGLLVLGGDTLTTRGKNKVNIPFEVYADGEYEVLIRIGYAHHRGNLAVHVDGFPLTTIRPAATSWVALKWTRLGALYLDKGKHVISFTNDGLGYNDIDAVAIVEKSTLKQEIEETLHRLEDYRGRIIHLISAAHAFSNNLPPEWHLPVIPYQGIICESSSSSTIHANVTLPRTGQYRIAARVGYGPELGNITVRFNNFTATVSCKNDSQGFRWVELGESFLTNSNVTVFIDSVGRVQLDQLAFYSVSETDNSTTLNHIFSEDGLNPPPSVCWNKIDETRYVVHLKTEKPVFLVFSETYHPLWKASIDNHEISSTVAYFVVNSFFINKTGEFDVVIWFKGQFYADVGLKLSIATWILVVVGFIVCPRLHKKIEKQWFGV